MKTNSVRVALMRQSAWIAIVAALGMGALVPQPAHALEAQELTGWWIAIDETLPKLWKQGAVAPMEEVVQIEADGAVTDRVDLPVAIQNAPEYLGVGLTPAGIRTLARNHPNFRILKGEGPALAIRQVIEEAGDSVTVFNGRGGLELIDNLRAGCAGVIPASDTFDRQARIFDLLREGAETHAEALYRDVLPAIVFVMQSLDTLHTYGKRIAAMRLGLGEVFDRAPALAPNDFGMRCAQRYAAALGPLA